MPIKSRPQKNFLSDALIWGINQMTFWSLNYEIIGINFTDKVPVTLAPASREFTLPIS